MAVTHICEFQIQHAPPCVAVFMIATQSSCYLTFTQSVWRTVYSESDVLLICGEIGIYCSFYGFSFTATHSLTENVQGAETEAVCVMGEFDSESG